METFYTAYTRNINDQTFYFVKKYNIFPEFNAQAAILDSYAMHSDFLQACTIAKIIDEAIIDNLIMQLDIVPEEARTISMHKQASFTYSLFRNTQQLLSKLRLAGIN